ncbi:UPF0696 protein C11orf68 homolog [Branchiostoma lanceolatum]|uniref:UPF0696 protein C11orf68 homolog n=1 Tax=Branchiostoma lanceolatum TaxID=7740 RepID=UPI0034547838
MEVDPADYGYHDNHHGHGQRGDHLHGSHGDAEKTSDDYAAEAMAADMDRWITFDARVKDLSDLDPWLNKFAPSKVMREDGVGWIAVRAESDVDDPLQDVVHLQEGWENLKHSGRAINLETITSLALNNHCTVGKWLFHVEDGFKVDYAWSAIARGVVEGKLGSCAKVSPASKTPDAERRHVVCVYNMNYTNRDEVWLLENAIRHVGIKCPMSYKPDAYTYLGIYRKNKWGLRPTIYHSDFDVSKGSSVIAPCF